MNAALHRSSIVHLPKLDDLGFTANFVSVAAVAAVVWRRPLATPPLLCLESAPLPPSTQAGYAQFGSVFFVTTITGLLSDCGVTLVFSPLMARFLAISMGLLPPKALDAFIVPVLTGAGAGTRCLRVDTGAIELDFVSN